jgi:hypothetical protein
MHITAIKTGRIIIDDGAFEIEINRDRRRGVCNFQGGCRDLTSDEIDYYIAEVGRELVLW